MRITSLQRGTWRALGSALASLPLAALALLTSSAQALQCDNLLFPGRSYETETPFDVVLGDLNGDGQLDMVAASEYSDGMTVRLGLGDGTFGPRSFYDTGNFPVAVNLGDMDGDGDLDVVVTNTGMFSRDVRIMLGVGDGTFVGGPAYSTGYAAMATAIGDLDGDGDFDVVTTISYNNELLVMLGNGDGTLTVGASVYMGGAGGSVRSIALADLDGDGRLDAVTSNQWGFTASVLMGNGDGTFGANTDYPVGVQSWPGSGLSGLGLGDVNGDGNIDLAVACERDDAVSVLLGAGDGSFGSEVQYPTGDYPNDLALVDLDADGILDVLTANHVSHDVSVLRGLLGGTFVAPAAYTVGTEELSLAVGELDGDGNLDVVVASFTDMDVAVLLGAPGGTFWAPRSYSVTSGLSSAGAVELADFDADGDLDMVTSNGPNNATLSVLQNTGSGTFGAALVHDLATPGEHGTHDVKSGDVDGDGVLDLVTVFWSGAVGVHLGNGDGTFATAVVYPSSGYQFGTALALGDLDGDGDLDIAATSGSPELGASGVWWLLGNGDGTFAGGAYQELNALPSRSRDLALGDVDGDGKLDLVVTGYSTNAVTAAPDGLLYVMLGTGLGTFSAPLSYTAVMGSLPAGGSEYHAAWSVSLGDIDADGDLDAVVINRPRYSPPFGRNAAVTMIGAGDGSFVATTSLPVGTGPTSAALADLDGDGWLDLAVVSAWDPSGYIKTEKVGVSFGSSSGFSEQLFYAAGDSPVDVAVGDLDGDGLMDLTTLNWYDKQASVLLSRCSSASSFDAYCTALPNSVGSGALISGVGTSSVAANDMGLNVTGAIPFQPGLFYMGPNQIAVPFGNGMRCVGGGTHRLAVVLPDMAGDVSFALDNTLAAGGGVITPGSTWNFQLWYRDPSVGVGFNLSNGLAVAFVP